MDYASWLAQVQAQGGQAVTLPTNVPAALQAYVGQPAARYSNAQYAALWNAGRIDPNAPQVAANSGAYVYVLAPSSAWTGAPHTMTTGETITNAVFSAGDDAADAVGLGGTLSGITNFLHDVGYQVAVGLAVTAAVAYLLKRKR